MSQVLRIPLNRPQALIRRKILPKTTSCTPWGRGVGKSENIRRTWWEHIAKYDGEPRRTAIEPFSGVRIVHMMPTFKQFVDTYKPYVERDLAGRWSFLGGKINHSRWRIEFPGGSFIQVFSAEAAQHARSMRCDMVTLDECDDIDKEVYDAVVVPWLSERWSFKIRLLAGTPRRGRRGLLYRTHRLALDGKPNHSTVHATYRDAPEIVDAELVAEAKRDSDPATFAREWECDFDSAEGLVFPMFSEAAHVREPPENVAWREIVIGVDWGWNDPGVFIAYGIAGNGRDAVAWAIDEVYEPRRELDWWAEKAAAWRERFPTARWYADPSRPDSAASLARKAGINLSETDNTIEDGISTMANLMAIRDREDGTKVTRFFTSAKCQNLIRELGLYRHKRDTKTADKFSDTIEDRDNHTIDASRYGLHSRLGKTIGRRLDRSATQYDDAG